jgi:hypothetical protein
VAPNALNQMFLPPVLLLRLLFPAVVGFNLIVAAPFPIGAVGTWLYLRRRFTPASAAFGALAFAAGGPVVSTANFPNLSWSIAWLPWLLWALERDREAPSARRLALVATVAALQMLSGEPVTLIGTLTLAAADVALGARGEAAATRLRPLGRLVAGITLAAAMSAVQLVPMTLAARESVRGLMPGTTFWSLHPLWLAESILPQLFGQSFDARGVDTPWLWPLNSGRDPFFYSMYLGPPVLLLAVFGAATAGRRWRVFWIGVTVASTVCALGEYTPVYPVLQQVVPLVRTFRFPIKFFLFASFALAVLAAGGVNALQRLHETPPSRTARRMTAAVTIGTLAVLMGLIVAIPAMPFAAARGAYRLGALAGLGNPVDGAAFLFRTLPPTAARSGGLLAAALLLAYLAWGVPRQGWVAQGLFFTLVIGDLLIVNARHNPTMPAARLGPPAWTAALARHPSDRFYFGGKFQGTLRGNDGDLPQIAWRPAPGVRLEEGRSMFMATLALAPAAWGVRELVSYDLPLLWPVEHAMAEDMFQRADRAARLRFLARGGVRYCVLGDPPYAGAPPLQRVGDEFGPMAVYECVREARRAYVVPAASIVTDRGEQLLRLFDAAPMADATAMLEQAAPGAAGLPGAPGPASARITMDEAEQVAVQTTVDAGGGYLVLLDAYDPAWQVTVDGRPAALLRANALFRAVRLSPGVHAVRFAYRPRAAGAWLAASGLAAAAVLALVVSPFGRRRQHAASRRLEPAPVGD